ncbi:MAG: biotin/lipoyl-containing protein, partial [Pseudomonadota bacterium]|nr:biotin/lipoyl-containing protein [Pseudomonadota bacterium]
IASVLPFHQLILSETDFVNEFKVHTRWIEQAAHLQYPTQDRARITSSSMLQRHDIEIDGKIHQIGLPTSLFNLTAAPQIHKSEETFQTHQENDVLAPISGVVMQWKVTENTSVKEGDVIGVMEAMKMEVQIIAHRTGLICNLVQPNKTVTADEKIAEIN